MKLSLEYILFFVSDIFWNNIFVIKGIMNIEDHKRAVEMSQYLRALVVFPKAPGLIPST